MVVLTILLTIVGALLPALIWLFFFLKEDIRPEPARLVIYTFMAGGLISMPVLASQLAFQNLILAIVKNSAVLIIGLAFLEEIFKFLAAYWIVNKETAFDEPIDAMVYMVTAALGFASIENIFITAHALDTINIASVANVINTLVLRFVGATFLHVLASGLLGYHWAKGRMKNTLFKSIVYGLFLATAVHTLFNYLILKFQNTSLIYPSIFLILAAFFVLSDFEKLKT